MKFEVELTQHLRRTVSVFADNRDDAAAKAREHLPGFKVEGATELLDGDEPGEEHTALGGCEACGAVVWYGTQYGSGEDAYLCEKCCGKAQEA